jgi:hypothetical protein
MDVQVGDWVRVVYDSMHTPLQDPSYNDELRRYVYEGTVRKTEIDDIHGMYLWLDGTHSGYLRASGIEAHIKYRCDCGAPRKSDDYACERCKDA